MSIKTFVAGDTFPNLTITPAWDGLNELTNATGILYTGDFANYSTSNPFSGALTMGTVTEAATGSSVVCTYDVTDTDTVVGRYTLNVQITYEGGEIETIKDVARITVVAD